MKQPLFSDLTIAFIAPLVFLCCAKTGAAIHIASYFSTAVLSFVVTLSFSLASLPDFLTFILILSTGDCNVDISEQVITR